MGERVRTVGGNKASRPITDFGLSIVKEFYVCSVTGDDGRAGTSPETAKATLAEALEKCTADKNDIIYLMPGHAETIISAGQIDIDVDGVKIVGLGHGDLRPTFTFTTSTAATILVTADDVDWSNFVVVGGINLLASPIVVSGANVSLDFESKDQSATVEMLRAVLTEDTADNFKLKLTHKGYTTGDAGVNAVRLVGANNADLDINYYGEASTSVVEFYSDLCTNVKIKGNFYNDSAALTKNIVDTATSSTWAAEIFDAKGGYKLDGGSNNALAVGDLSVIASDVAGFSASVADIVAAASDAVIAASDISASASDIAVIQSDLKIADALIDTIKSDLIVTNAIVDTIASDLVIADTVADKISSDLIIADTVIDKVSSDLIAHMAKYASDMTALMSDLATKT